LIIIFYTHTKQNKINQKFTNTPRPITLERLRRFAWYFDQEDISPISPDIRCLQVPLESGGPVLPMRAAVDLIAGETRHPTETPQKGMCPMHLFQRTCLTRCWRSGKWRPRTAYTRIAKSSKWVDRLPRRMTAVGIEEQPTRRYH
jgi:hypothetical protein